MTFDEFKTLVNCDADSIEKFRDQYWVMVDLNGAVFSETIGFHISVCGDPDDPQDVQDENDSIELIEKFKPLVIWAGTREIVERLKHFGYSSVLFPWFQDGAFAVVLKTPIRSGELTS